MTHHTSAYARAGVDIEAGDRAVELMKDAVKAATRPEVLGGLGGFAGMFDASALTRFRRPVLSTSTDGVGTKVAIAQAMDRHDTIGQDLVGMVVDDIIVTGAEPLFMTDYIACGRVVPERIAAIVSGIARGCELAGCALIGGETAEHPGLMGAGEYDLAGAVTGVVEHDQILGSHRVQAGDVAVAVASSGLHSNGYSLVRHVLLTQAGLDLHAPLPEYDGISLGDVLLAPTRIYALVVLAINAATEIHAWSHITGGGLANNLARVVPSHLSVALDRSTWTPEPIFGLVQRLGAVSRPDVEATLNQGVGMVALVPAGSVAAVVRGCEDAGMAAWPCGEVREGDGSVTLHGAHPAA